MKSVFSTGSLSLVSVITASYRVTVAIAFFKLKQALKPAINNAFSFSNQIVLKK